MSSFTTHRLRVYDEALPPYRRLSNLRTCLERFAPYGFRATYHHLVRSAGIPGRLADDPAALVRAVEELHAARELWLPDTRLYAARRRREKQAGLRGAAAGDSWRRWGQIAYCPAPELHPRDPLPVVVARVLSAPDDGPLCRACGLGPPGMLWNSGYGTYELCTGCGVQRSKRIEPPSDRSSAIEQGARWKAVWAREL
ncbi:hypothetical protein [Streptomyces sp. NPDC050738]|uniref:hypothetical protein n=1 Tax=Streptomyces sp. NPDC050738 TaxID=3154744 RepID=UPI00342E62C0